MRSRGFGLAEGIVACFLLVFGFLIMGNLFDAALKWTGRSYNQQIAVHLAERKMAEIRRWSLETHGDTGTVSFKDNWASQVGGPFGYPDFPGYAIFVDVDIPTPPPLPGGLANPGAGFYSPCSRFFLENTDPAADFQRSERWGTYPYTRLMSNSLRRVEVRVEWTEFEFALVSLVGDPLPELGTLTITQESGGPTVNRDGVAIFRLDVEDVNNRVLDDLVVLWDVETNSDGAGILRVLDNANGHRVEFKNFLFDDPAYAPVGSQVRIGARVRYKGEERVAWSNSLSLGP